MRSMKRKNVNSPTPMRNGGPSSFHTYRSRMLMARRPLYDSLMRASVRLGMAVMALGLSILAVRSTSAGAGPDRLERFKELARRYADAPDAGAGAALSEVLSLIDAEIIESLKSGGPFASSAFLQERLEGFT